MDRTVAVDTQLLPVNRENADTTPLTRGPSEIESFSAVDGHVVRSVQRRSGRRTSSRLAPWPGGDRNLSSDQAEGAFLRRPDRPTWGLGTETLPFVDLFSGCGSLSLGVLEAARALHMRPELRLAADVDISALRVLRASLGVRARVGARLNVTRHVKAAPEATTSKAERQLVERVGSDVRLVVAGPPCQGHSTLNNYSRHDDVRNHLYLRVVRFARLTEPDYVLIENVAAIERDKRRSAERAVEALGRSGYHVDHGLVDLHALGVPQLRRRHVLIACAPHVPALSVEQVVTTHTVEDKDARSVGWAISGLEDPTEPRPFDLASTPSPENRRRIAWLHRRGEYDLPNPLRPPCHQGPHAYKSMYGRLDWDRPAQTITSGYGSMGQGRYVHPRRERTLTPHEAARLQMIPDFFDFSSVDSRSAWAQMIGNAAPWKLSYVFALEMFR